MKRYAEYKDSGVPWIGVIPRDWEVKRFRYCFNTRTGISITKSELLDDGIDCIGYGQIHSKYGFDLDLDRDYLKKVPETFLEMQSSAFATENDFIFCDTSEDVKGAGNNVYVKNIAGKQLMAGSHTILAHPTTEFQSRFLAYLFGTKNWKAQIQSNVFGVKVFSITQKILKESILILPPRQIQDTIINFLDCKTAAIDGLIADKQKMIDLLKEKRQAIISEAVTKGLDKTVPMKDSGIEWIGEIPEGWTVSTLGKLTESLSNGYVGPTRELFVDAGVKYLQSLHTE